VGERAFATDTIVSTSAPHCAGLSATARTDFKLTEKDSLMARYSFNRSKALTTGAFGALRDSGEPAIVFQPFQLTIGTWTRSFLPPGEQLSFTAIGSLNSIPAFSPTIR